MRQVTHNRTQQPPASRTAAALVIGNELLSGKIPEKNVRLLAPKLRSLGINLRRVVMIPDEIDLIAEEVRLLSQAHDLVFTSGGIGPTHDDVTVEGVARAFGRKVITSDQLVSEIQRSLGDELTEGHLLMSRIPEGARLVGSSRDVWSTVSVENVWLLPGVPELFSLRLKALVPSLRRLSERPFLSEFVTVRMDEGRLLPIINRVVTEFPDVLVGSYPESDDRGAYTKITFDGKDQDRIAEARRALTEYLKPYVPVDRSASRSS